MNKLLLKLRNKNVSIREPKSVLKHTLLIVMIVSTTYGVTADIIERLSLQKQRANLYILNNFAGDWTPDGNLGENKGIGSNWESIDFQLKQFQIPTIRNLPSIVAGNEVTAATEICAYAKQYLSSQEFIDAYRAKREKAKPTSEPYRPDAATIKSQKAAIKEAEANLLKVKKMMSAQQVAQMQNGIEQMKKQVAEWDDPAPNKTRWEKMYPENPSLMIKQRLEEYLAIAATVDFNAQLTASGRKQKFVNPAYENQSLKWKAIFRAGKDVNDEVTEFVKKWLKEIVINAK